MQVLISKVDLIELVEQARHLAATAKNETLNQLMASDRFLRTMFGQLINLAVNGHVDNGNVVTFVDVTEGLVGSITEEDGASTLRYVINEAYVNIRMMLVGQIAEGWVYDVQVIEEQDIFSGVPMPVAGFVIRPLVSRQAVECFSDLINLDRYKEWLADRDY